ncbi:MAG: hypothetical protein JXA57_16845 [Armatimonadetes bacterium]|nr:hypothetical protein [Armatimonadota bacterium]
MGHGQDATIAKLAETVRRVVGCHGEIIWDTSKLDSTPQKLLNVSQARSQGWEGQIELEEGLWQMYDWFLRSYA